MRIRGVRSERGVRSIGVIQGVRNVKPKMQVEDRWFLVHRDVVMVMLMVIVLPFPCRTLARSPRLRTLLHPETRLARSFGFFVQPPSCLTSRWIRQTSIQYPSNENWPAGSPPPSFNPVPSACRACQLRAIASASTQPLPHRAPPQTDQMHRTSLRL